jgi:hypothetical protein
MTARVLVIEIWFPEPILELDFSDKGNMESDELPTA